MIAVRRRQMGESQLDSLAGSTGRADEDDLGVGLGSGTIRVTGLVKYPFVRQQFDRQAFGVSVQRSSDPCPSTFFPRSTTKTDVACGQTSQETPTIQWTKPTPTLSYQRDEAAIRYAATI